MLRWIAAAGLMLTTQAAGRGAAAEQAMRPLLQAPTLAALLDADAAGLAPAQLVAVAGYRTAADGGGGTFVWTPGDGRPADGVLAFQPAHAEGRWLRLWPGGSLPPEAAGAAGDGQQDDSAAFARLVDASRNAGAFTIQLLPGRRYYLSQGLDMSVGAPGLTLSGAGAPRSFAVAGRPFPVCRIELDAATGATVKLGDSQTLRDALIWRHGLPDRPTTLAEVRAAVGRWAAESGNGAKLSVGVFAPFSDVNVDHVVVIGFHTGIKASGARFKIRHVLIDAAGYAMDVGGSKDTSLIEDVQARDLWSIDVPGEDALGNHGFRPGTGFYIHGGADGLQVNSVMSIAWATGIWLDGPAPADDWLISLFQPNVETPPNDGRPTAAIRTTGSVRRLTIIDPRIVFGGSGPASGLEFLHANPDAGAAANNNVTVIGGAIEVGAPQGVAILLGPGSDGAVIGTTIAGNGRTPLIRALPGVGRWELRDPQLRASSSPLIEQRDTQHATSILLNGEPLGGPSGR